MDVVRVLDVGYPITRASHVRLRAQLAAEGETGTADPSGPLPQQF
ncbi:MAG: hypothetical protein ACK2U2_21740 [Anaerolineae bacterium]